MSRPLLFLDVDGPLNPYYARPREHPDGYALHRITPSWLARHWGAASGEVEPVDVWLNPSHGERLLALSYDLVWATTWMEEANHWISPRLGLPALPYVPFHDVWAWRPDDTCFKTWDIVAWAEGRPFAWVDDDISEADRAYVAAHHPGPALLRRVHPARGLAEDDFDLLASWAADLSIP